MGKGRKPCCDKAGVKKGPWSQVEDLKLISFIDKHGHSNWRALPKLAGLARCGKSCRLRWVNYLRPDLKRGNFTSQEEETIIKLHEILGNKWSKIASYFPGRTDNEIKNVWNTHLKKRIKVKESNDKYVTSKEFAPDENNKDCSQVLLHQTSSISDMMEHTSSSSNSYSLQMSDSNPQLDKGVPNSQMVEQNVCDTGGTTHIEVDKIKGDLLDELIEIPFEPNLEMWDLLDGDSNSVDNCDHVQSNELESPKLNPIFENDKKDYRESDGSWWWVMYLENELGLNHNEATPLQPTSGSNGGLIFKEKGGYFSDITI